MDNNSIQLTPNSDILSGKQDKLTAGENITIENNVISASGGENLYRHCLSCYGTNCNFQLTVISSISSEYTLLDLQHYLTPFSANGIPTIGIYINNSIACPVINIKYSNNSYRVEIIPFNTSGGIYKDIIISSIYDVISEP